MYFFALALEVQTAFCGALGFPVELGSIFGLGDPGWIVVFLFWGFIAPELLDMGNRRGWQLPRLPSVPINVFYPVAICVSLLPKLPGQWKHEGERILTALLGCIKAGLDAATVEATALQAALIITLPYVNVVCILLGIVELAYYATWLILVEATWVLVYCKLAIAFFGPFRWSRYYEYCASESVPGSTILSGVSPAQQQWKEMVFDALANAVLAELKDRVDCTPLHDLSVLSFVDEVASMVIRLLRLPRLQHLTRPFRREALLPFLMTYPYWRFTRRCTPPDVDIKPDPIEGLACTELVDFHLALASFMPAAAKLRTSRDNRLQLFTLHLRAISTGDALAAAEEPLFEAILDTVLDWKAQKLELDRARRRIKQD
ncbi:hypothetical protein JCM10207_002818 [Rhodosporidiobolus poonsookiae]